jgi:hypothetical protein
VALAAPTEVERGQWYFQRYVSRLLDYPDKDAAVVGSPDSLIVGSSAVMARDVGEQTAG